MSHVDDGRLHAYLDGALEHYPPGEAEAVRKHLASCSECAVRLEEARAVRDRSRAVLDGALPDVGPLPDLEELRGEADRRRGARTRRSAMARLGWAATVVISLGAGWMARELTGPGGTPPAPLPEARPVVQPTVSDEARDAEGEETPASAEEAAGEAPAEGPGEAPPEAPTEVREEGEEETVASEAAPAAPEPITADTGGLPPEDVLRPALQAPGAGTAAAERRHEADVAPARAAQLLDALERPPAPAHRTLGVEGLEFLSVVRLPVAEGTALRILQRLPRGDTLALFHLLDGADPSALPVLDEGETELTLPTGEGWVVLRARRDSEELRALAGRLPR